MGLLPVAPTGHIPQQFAQLGGRLFAFCLELGLGGDASGGRKFRRLERQTAQQNRNPVKNGGQAEVGAAGGVGHTPHHGENSTANRDKAAGRQQIFHRRRGKDAIVTSRPSGWRSEGLW